jgi:hypothetical protein
LFVSVNPPRLPESLTTTVLARAELPRSSTVAAPTSKNLESIFIRSYSFMKSKHLLSEGSHNR